VLILRVAKSKLFWRDHPRPGFTGRPKAETKALSCDCLIGCNSRTMVRVISSTRRLADFRLRVGTVRVIEPSLM